MATISDMTYPFDPTGEATSNRITDEQQVVSNPNHRDYHFLVPRYAPFFEEGLQLTFWDANDVQTPLVKFVDWYPVFWFLSASRACAKNVYGGIGFLNKELTGRISMDYQAVGGDWSISEQKIAEILANRIQNPRVTAWEQVANPPYAFPIIDHPWDLIDLVGMKEVNLSLTAIASAIAQQGSGGLQAHINNTSNPHQVTKAQVGLSLVRNLTTATISEAIAGTSDDLYMTPLSTLAMVNDKAVTAISAHVLNLNNPHQTTAAQVGTYSKAQLDDMFSNVVSTTGTAANTLRFAGMDSTEFRDWVNAETAANSLKLENQTLAQVIALANAGSAQNAIKFDGKTSADWLTQLDSRYSSAEGMAQQRLFQYVDPASGGTYTNLWMQLGTIVFPDLPNGVRLDTDLEWLVGGVGTFLDNTKSTSLMVRISGRGTTPNFVNGNVTNMTGLDSAVKIGYVVASDNKSAIIYIKTSLQNQRITVTELSKGIGTFGDGSLALTVEPTGIQYLTEDRYALASEVAFATDLINVLDSLTTTLQSLT